MNKPCEHCPWRLKNQGKRSPWGFYTKPNLRRLWNQIRGGGAEQSCHPTDPGHPDHVAAGAKPGTTPRECPGSVILVLREVRAMANEHHTVTPESMEAYFQIRKKGLKKPWGVTYWLISRIQLGGVSHFGGPKLPEVDIDDPEIGLPAELAEG